jgi:hypothetical protein
MWSAVLVIALAACSRDGGSTSTSTSTSTSASTIQRRDYVGPEVCAGCHAEQYAAWRQSLHRVMNARANEPGAVIGDFATTLSYAGGRATFTRERDALVMIVAKQGRSIRYRVTRTIGRRGLQEYVGIADGRSDEVRLPFGWWPRAGGWYPQPYFDPWLGSDAGFDAYSEVTEPWAERCPWCHSTYPFVQRIARCSGPAHLGHGLEQLYEAPPGSERLDVADQVTTGISCESCHLGGRAHVDGAPIRFVPDGAPRKAGSPVLPASFADERRDADVVDAVCAQCHSGPSPRLADGTALRNSSESLDLAASPCRGIRCTDCHDPHRGDARGDERRAVAACTRCHDRLAASVAARAHAGAGHGDATCLDCHMPRFVMGIDRFVRTHRISSPGEPSSIGGDVPNACNLCHIDRTLRWTVDALRDGWDLRISPGGPLDEPAGSLWLASASPAMRVITASALARSPLGAGSLGELARGLADPLAYVRAWTKLAFEDALGHAVPLADYDPRAPADARARAIDALLARRRASSGTPRPPGASPP